MSDPTVSADELASRIDDVSGKFVASVTEPTTDSLRNLAIGIAVVAFVAYRMGRKRGKRSRRR